MRVEIYAMHNVYPKDKRVCYNTIHVLYNYIILDGIEGCMRIYCTRHDDIRYGEVNIIMTSADSHTIRNKVIQYYYYYIIWSWL